MITPTKYMDIETSVLAISGTIILILKDNPIIPYADLLNYVLKLKGIKAKENFLYALSFLFLMDKIHYHKNIDSIEIIL